MVNSENSEENPLAGWTKEDKFQLLEALKDMGSQDPAQIKSYIPSKKVDEIITALNYYKEKTNSMMPPLPRQKSIKPPTIPLASWAKYISDNHSIEELHTETATALRLIADFEDRPLPVCTEGIDFKKIYHMIADALEGKTLPQDKINKKIIDKCAVETALTSKVFMRSTRFKQLLSSIDVSEIDIEFVPKVTDNKELENLRHLALQKSYNPLNIPQNYLKSSQMT